jgi:pyruvate/2-oxoglutarate dehydrogenase complex dihydrolipoamide dehydrogenase (E3) component
VGGFDYDLVIVGGSDAGRLAAAKAAKFSRRLPPRVALVEDLEPERSPALPDLHRQTLIQAGRVAHQLGQADLWGFARAASSPIQWPDLRQWTERVAETLGEARSPHLLAMSGVDVVQGQGVFQPEGLAVKDRLLRSRLYLLAPATVPFVPPELANIDYLTHDRLIDCPQIPDRLIILSHEPAGIELAQSFQRLGSEVTLVVPDDHLLKAAEPLAMQWLQAELEAEGVTVLTRSSVTQAAQQGELKRLRVGDKVLEAEAVLVMMGRRTQLEDLCLDRWDIQWNDRGIVVDQFLRTTHFRVYACGESLGGYALPEIAEYEVAIAVRNMLGLTQTAIDYGSVQWGMQTQPEFAQVGMTEAAAKRLYSDVKVDRWQGGLDQQFPLSHQGRAAMQNQSDGFCQVVRRQGKVLGVQAIGVGASEVVRSIYFKGTWGSSV